MAKAKRKTFDFDVFLSHSSKDKPTVRALAVRLKKDGLKVWFDDWEIVSRRTNRASRPFTWPCGFGIVGWHVPFR